MEARAAALHADKEAHTQGQRHRDTERLGDRAQSDAGHRPTRASMQ
jgi:hypothetical protein